MAASALLCYSRAIKSQWGERVGKVFGRAAAVALALVLAFPAGAQSYSDGFVFLKAVRERDGTKATELADHPGTTVVNARDAGSGEAAIHIVTRGRDLNWLSFLIGKGARTDLQNGRGETALALAAQLGWTDGAELLLSQGASVDLPNQRGETPLILAVHNRDMPMVRMLVGHGADPKKADYAAGYSALDYARQDSRAQPLLRVLESRSTAPARPAAGPKP
jgi:hypothetical protein